MVTDYNTREIRSIRDRVLLGANVVQNDVVGVVLLHWPSKVDADLKLVPGILFFDGMQQGMEPFGLSIVSNDPHEVDLRQPGAPSVVEAVHSIPDRL